MPRLYTESSLDFFLWERQRSVKAFSARLTMRFHWLAWVGKWTSVSEKVGVALPQSFQETKVSSGLNSVSGVCTGWRIRKFFDHQVKDQRIGAEVITRWNLLIWGSVGKLSGIFFTSPCLKQDQFMSLRGYGRLVVQLGGRAFVYHPFLGFTLSNPEFEHANRQRLISLHARLPVAFLPSVARSHSCFYYCLSFSVRHGFATWHRLTLNLGPLASAFRVPRLERCSTTPALQLL